MFKLSGYCLIFPVFLPKLHSFQGFRFDIFFLNKIKNKLFHFSMCKVCVKYVSSDNSHARTILIFSHSASGSDSGYISSRLFLLPQSGLLFQALSVQFHFIWRTLFFLSISIFPSLHYLSLSLQYAVEFPQSLDL